MNCMAELVVVGETERDTARWILRMNWKASAAGVVAVLVTAGAAAGPATAGEAAAAQVAAEAATTECPAAASRRNLEGKVVPRKEKEDIKVE